MVLPIGCTKKNLVSFGLMIGMLMVVKLLSKFDESEVPLYGMDMYNNQLYPEERCLNIRKLVK